LLRRCWGRGGWRDHHGRSRVAGLLLCFSSLTRWRSWSRLSRGWSRGQCSHEPERSDTVNNISHQKLNLAITSIVRIEPALVTRPNDEDPSVAEIPENAGVFVKF